MERHRIGTDVTVLNDHAEIPGLGFLPINAFVLHAAQPVVVDTGLSLPDRDFVARPRDGDGSRRRALDLAHPPRPRPHRRAVRPARGGTQARVITTFLGVGIMSTERPLPLDRVYLLNPGQQLDIGDRTLHAFRPPLFDSPATAGFYDDRSRAVFSSDCFGAPLTSAELATGTDVRAVPDDDAVRAAAVGHRRQPLGVLVDRAAYGHAVDEVRNSSLPRSSAPTCRPRST